LYFPVAGIEVNPFLPPAVAFIISFFTSMAGVSGAFLLLPFQVSILGFNSPAVSGTNHLFNIVAIPSGVYRYIKEGRMVWPLTWVVIIGTLPGVLIGAIVRIQYLPDPRSFKMFAGLVLLYIGCRMLKNLFATEDSGNRQNAAEAQFQERVNQTENGKERNQLQKVHIKKVTLLSIEYGFYGQDFRVGTVGITVLSFVVGIIGGVYGIGGGAIIAPFFISFLRLPVYTVAGATLMGTFVTSVAGVLFYQLIAPFYPGVAVAPDWALGFLFGIGGFGGMYFGARLQKFISARLIKWILVVCILFTAAKYIIEFII